MAEEAKPQGRVKNNKVGNQEHSCVPMYRMDKLNKIVAENRKLWKRPEEGSMNRRVGANPRQKSYAANKSRGRQGLDRRG